MPSRQSHQVVGGLSLSNGVSLERNGVTEWRNDVSVKRADTISRRKHVSLVVGFRRPDLGLGSSIGVREEVGRNAAASTRSAKITVSICEVPDRTENLPPGRRPATHCETLGRTEDEGSIIPRENL